MLSDIEIARNSTMRNITEIAAELGLNEDDYELYGKYKAKISDIKLPRRGKLILITAMTPTKQGDGKTTISIGLADGLRKIGKKSILALREPSLGPVFGMKGGATGGGYSQIVPMEDINLHFTGDFHAITSANNLLCALIDNHLQQGNVLGIDPRTVTFKRCLDMNDRALRNVIIGMGGKSDGVVREDHFCITVATEVMAIFCLATSLADLEERLGNITVAMTYDKREVKARDLKAQGAMTVLLKEAFRPNLVQTLEGTPAIVHGGPFANIAHGCNSIAATDAALRLADYTVTEAGFGSDLGAEKFLDIKCREAGISPDCTVLVATIKAMKLHGNGDIKTGFANVRKHYDNLHDKFGLNVVVDLNKFGTDTDEEVELFRQLCAENKMVCAVSTGFVDGGSGCIELAEKVASAAENSCLLKYLYELSEPVKEKIDHIARKCYGANGVVYSAAAAKKLSKLAPEYNSYPVCVAKTQYSFSDDPKQLNVPENFNINVRDIEVKSGSRFIVVYLGEIITMPGLPIVPNAEAIKLVNGETTGLF
ncbi:MAG: formate--tetrahydrofolate ligase [Lentisphaerae bacterium]|nr:formate--tetrahydrofolate ligase [Lentisphaerota bacterium]